MIFLLGILTELCIEIWDEKFREICVRWPYTDNAPSGSWNCPECNALNQYVDDNKPVAYCRCCGQTVDMNYYRRHANDTHMDT